MTLLQPNYTDILNKLGDDIKDRTGLNTIFQIDNEIYEGDTPTLILALKGTIGLGMTAAKSTDSHKLVLNLSLKSKAANIANLADIISSEAKASFAFPMAADIQAVQSERYVISGVEDYNVAYFTKWNIPTDSMNEKQFQRNWDLYLNITRRRN